MITSYKVKPSLIIQQAFQGLFFIKANSLVLKTAQALSPYIKDEAIYIADRHKLKYDEK